jgi:hypothetical protein
MNLISKSNEEVILILTFILTLVFENSETHFALVLLVFLKIGAGDGNRTHVSRIVVFSGA